jgi:hypothetical protein
MSDATVQIRNTIEALVWTIVAAGGSSLIGGPLLGIALWKAAAIAGGAAAVEFLTRLARSRLDVLPAPGEGMSIGSYGRVDPR